MTWTAALRTSLLVALVACVSAAAQATAPSPPPTQAQTPAVQAVLDRVAKGQAAILTVRLPFVQEKHLAIMDDPLITNGAIEIDRHLGAVRWEFIGKSVMIFAKGRIHRWGADGTPEGMPNDPNLKPFQDQMQAFVSGDWSSLEQAFTLESPGDKPLLTLTPHSPQLAKYLARIELRFRDDYSAPLEMTMTAAGGDQTIYRFSDPQLGVAFASGHFDKP